MSFHTNFDGGEIKTRWNDVRKKWDEQNQTKKVEKDHHFF